MKKWSKAGIVCAAVLAASMAMTACGGKTAETGNTGEAGSTGAAGTEKAADEKTPEASKSSGEIVKLSFSWWGNDDRHQATQNAIDAFNAAHAGAIEVTGEPSGFGNLEETFATRYAGGTAADVMTVNYPWVIQYSPNGDGFYDLDQVKDIIDFSQYDEGFLEFGKTGGKMQAVPYGQNTLGLYVNKSAFDRAGITELPTTFEEYKKAAEIFTQHDPNAYMIVSPTFRFAAVY